MKEKNNNNEQTLEYALDNKCPTCGASISYNPKSGKWDCKYCKNSFTLEELKNHNNASNEKNNDNTKSEVSEEYITYKCKNCGAEIITDEQTSSTFCVYCRSTTILKNKLTGKFAPDKIIPFKKVKEDAVKAFSEILKHRPLAPRDFNSEKNIEKIRGIYIPFWIFDISEDGSLECNAQKVRSWTSGDIRYTKTDYYKVYRTGKMSFINVPHDGSTRFNDDIMSSIEPFDYKDLTKYNHAYLSGFLAEKYDVTKEDAFLKTKSRTNNTAKNVMYNSVTGYTSKIITSNTITSTLEKAEYALFPVWMVNVKYNNKTYIFAMNGQTGEFIGDIPYDKKRIFLYTISIFIICILVCSLISYLIFLGGK